MKQSGKTFLVVLTLLIALAVLMSLFNPQAEQHQQAVANALRAESTQNLKILLQEQGGIQNLDQILGMGLLNVAQALGAVPWRYHNYIIISTLSLEDERGQDRWVTFGILGNVLVL